MNILGLLKERPITITGFALIVVGLAGPSVFATLNIDTVPPNVCGSFPVGGQSTPTSLEPNTTYTIYLIVDHEKVPRAWVLIDGVSKDLPTETAIYTGTYYSYKYSASWTSPSSSGTIKFEFKAKDAAGNIGSKTTYAIMGTPSGNFYINGHGPMNKESVLTLSTRDIVFKCIPTNYADQIDKVYVKISGDASVPVLDLTKGEDGNWTANWTAPKDGSYTIYGYVCAGDFGYQMMSVTVGMPEPEFPPAELVLNYFPYIGVGLVAIGLITKH